MLRRQRVTTAYPCTAPGVTPCRNSVEVEGSWCDDHISETLRENRIGALARMIRDSATLTPEAHLLLSRHPEDHVRIVYIGNRSNRGPYGDIPEKIQENLSHDASHKVAETWAQHARNSEYLDLIFKRFGDPADVRRNWLIITWVALNAHTAPTTLEWIRNHYPNTEAKQAASRTLLALAQQ